MKNMSTEQAAAYEVLLLKIQENKLAVAKEEACEILTSTSQGLSFDFDEGKVTVTRETSPSDEEVYEAVFNKDAFDTLTPAMKAKLEKLGVIKTVRKVNKGLKAQVRVSLRNTAKTK